ncbi:hypothetical protein JCM5353_000832, partial [Sporobolomyces roseus]
MTTWADVVAGRSPSPLPPPTSRPGTATSKSNPLQKSPTNPRSSATAQGSNRDSHMSTRSSP